MKHTEIMTLLEVANKVKKITIDNYGHCDGKSKYTKGFKNQTHEKLFNVFEELVAIARACHFTNTMLERGGMEVLKKNEE